MNQKDYNFPIIPNSNLQSVIGASPEILLAVMQNNIDFSFKNYSEVISEFKQTQNNTERKTFLEKKLFEVREVITNQKPIVKSFLLAFPSDRERVCDLIFSPLINFKDFLEEKIELVDEFHSDKSKKSLSKAKKSSTLTPDDSTLDELRSYIDDRMKSSVQSTAEAPKVDHEVLLRRLDVAKLFSVSVVTVSQWSKSGRLKSYRINSRVFFKRDEVMAAMKERGKKR